MILKDFFGEADTIGWTFCHHLPGHFIYFYSFAFQKQARKLHHFPSSKSSIAFRLEHQASIELFFTSVAPIYCIWNLFLFICDASIHFIWNFFIHLRLANQISYETFCSPWYLHKSFNIKLFCFKLLHSFITFIKILLI